MNGELERIENYFEGRMNNEEKYSFEKEIKENESFHTEVMNYILARKAISDSANERIKHNLTLLGKNIMIDKQKNKNRFLPKVLSIAAVLFLTIGLYRFFFYPMQKNTSSNLIEEYYKKPLLSDNIDRGTDEIKEWEDALFYYKKNNYDSALYYFQQISVLSEFNSPSIIGFYKGICYFETGRLNESINEFRSIGQETSVYFEAKWYLSLAYLKKGDIRESVNNLKVLNQSEQQFSSQSKQLLRKVKRLK